ncbi:Spo0E like sporulation regulatory protein [Natronincola peptidivorans]|uniref:Spo0E like sporulation regulatory protein n=1 Tax=Natronincola peptidivorans TaxID=426128 RepID=A0A1I0DPH3_9FIRM|nr:aspartyl-phosphate phosphatase Spo0E family protein [Natronincola peptidivorans]SET33790.1 Spo0E like sporulation regulatory protein [Natronincola peptidivorans]
MIHQTKDHRLPFEEIEKTRRQLHRLIQTKKGNLLDPEVITLSKHLDSLLTVAHRKKK